MLMLMLLVLVVGVVVEVMARKEYMFGRSQAERAKPIQLLG